MAATSLIAPGGSIAQGAIGDGSPAAGSTIVAGPLGPLSFAASDFSGTLTSTVLTGDTNNPFGTSGLDFVYRLTNDGSSASPIQGFSANGFAGFLTAISIETPPNINLQQVSASRLSGAGDTIHFGTNNPNAFATPGGPAETFVVYTNAHLSTIVSDTVQNGDVAHANALAPAVPEPASVIVWSLMGLIGLGYSWRRRSGM